MVSFFGLYSFYLYWIGLDVISKNETKFQFFIFSVAIMFMVKILLAAFFITIAKPEIIAI